MTTRPTSEPHPDLDRGLDGLAGVGPRRRESYAAAGLLTRRDLLYHLPSRYRARPRPVTVAELEDGGRGAVIGTVQRASVRRRGRRSTVSILLEDDAGDELLVLLFNRAYLAKALGRGTRLWVAGRAEVPEEDERPRLLAADYERLGEDDQLPGEALVPIYKLPAGVPPRVHRKLLAEILAGGGPVDWREPGPGEPALREALTAIHQPQDIEAARAGRARLARDEAWALSLEVAARRREESGPAGAALPLDDDAHGRVLGWLPHTPTAAQARVLDELRADLSRDRPMARLLQGDVGSGKTMMAVYALLAALGSGRQAALMAPTEVLAIQHWRGLSRLLSTCFGERAPEVALITGGGTAGERRRQRQALADGRIPLAVGTHGLATAGVTFDDLAVVVVDEQHRFGVRQRVRLRTKGPVSHLLVMTATPIPRTLALTAYGELDVSVLDELPPGRSPRTTRYVPPAKQEALWRHLGKEVAAGHRGYVVCPSISAGEDEGHSVAETLARVRERLGPDVVVEGVHGRLAGYERDELLEAFRDGAIDVLVATVLIEVGLDVPEATFVVVPDPARFGLATLHQIRGRVGRGRHPGACYLLGPVKGEAARERIGALVDSEDGFVLAEEDLRLRGPGEVLGTRQSGLPGFLVLDPVGDVDLLASTRQGVLAEAEGLDREALLALRERAFPRTELRHENLLAGG